MFGEEGKMKRVGMFIGFIIWTLLCIYGTYWNTIENAEPRAIENGYEIEYHNTGEIHYYQ